jgi:dTDP-4-dehydrorhamnose 3,5-epimerase
VNVVKTPLNDAFIVEPKVFEDDRGFFFESFNQKNFEEYAKVSFVQDNHSASKRGVLRGLHYQVNQPQGKLVRVVSGCVFDVAVDLRQKSSTFGQWFGVQLSDKNKKQFWIPVGFAHGFLVLSERAEFVYKTTDYYDSKSEQCISWDDKTLKIDWPCLDVDFSLSEKDKLGKPWQEAIKF